MYLFKEYIIWFCSPFPVRKTHTFPLKIGNLFLSWHIISTCAITMYISLTVYSLVCRVWFIGFVSSLCASMLAGLYFSVQLLNSYGLDWLIVIGMLEIGILWCYSVACILLYSEYCVCQTVNTSLYIII